MAIGWMTVLKLVPWAEVIKNAPAVAEGAKKLWDTVGRKPRPEAPPASTEVVVVGAPASDPVAALGARLAETEAEVDALQQQMQASSELIKALADQNAELIRRVEIQRVRQGWLVVLLAAAALLAGYALSVALAR